MTPLKRPTQPGTVAAPAATAFDLSRVYAKGWLAGSNHDVEESMDDVRARGDELNPCRADAERQRWMQGFTDAVERRLRGPGRTKPRLKTGQVS